MSDDKDPQRISEAADNCEVLRARLAKYEDADGNPLAALNQPSAGVDERAAFEVWFSREVWKDGCYGNPDILKRQLWPCWQARAQLAAPAGVSDGWRLVPVDPTPEMLEAGDKYIGTPATYRAMLSAAPSAAIKTEFSQFLSAVMDAAGLVRHGRQSKELSEYLGLMCMQYRTAAAPSPAPASDAVPYPERFKMKPYQTVDKGSTNYKAGWNAAVKAMEASDVVQVRRELANRLLSRSDTTDYQLACAELRALLNGGRS